MATLPKFDELNVIREEVAAEVYANVIDAQAGRPLADRKRLGDMIFDLLTMAYVYGLNTAGLDLYEDIPLDAERMRESVYEATAGKTAFERLTAHIDEANAAAQTATSEVELVTIAERLIDQVAVIGETEGHRVINEGVMDGAEWFTGNNPDAVVMKRWATMGDERVRDTHFYLEGVEIPLDAKFYTYDGDSALRPGGFAFAENNVNCRCITRLTRRQ